MSYLFNFGPGSFFGPGPVIFENLDPDRRFLKTRMLCMLYLAPAPAKKVGPGTSLIYIIAPTLILTIINLIQIKSVNIFSHFYPF